MEIFFQKLLSLSIKRETEGKLSYNESKSGNFFVKSLYSSFSRGFFFF